MDISTLSVQELKALAFDTHRNLMLVQENYRVLTEAIDRKIVDEQNKKSEEEAKKEEEQEKKK